MKKTLSTIIALAIAASAFNTAAEARIRKEHGLYVVLCEKGPNKGTESYYSTLTLAKSNAVRDCGTGNYSIDKQKPKPLAMKAPKVNATVGFSRSR